MARVIGNPFGELSGKMGGLVFARNKRGAYVRGYVIPVNPNTELQSSARNAFTSAVGGWHVLSDVQKNLWMSYATQYFSSKKLGNIAGGHSGINAFVSLRNTLLNIERKKLSAANTGIEINGVAVTVPTQASTILPILPPSQPFQPILGGGFYAVDSVGTTVFDSGLAGSMSFNLVYTGGSGVSPVDPEPTSDNLFEDANGSNLGIAIYASNALAQASQFVQNPEIVLLSSTGIITGYTVVAAVPATLTVAIDGSISSLIQRTEWLEGQQVRLDAYLFNSYGESSRIGSVIVNVTAP